MRIPTRTEITILTIAIVLLSALGLHARSTAAAPVMLFCPPGQSERTTYSYTGGWPQQIQTCGLDIIPGSVPIGLLVPTAQPEGFTVPDFNQGGTLIQTVPETLRQPEGITMPNYGTSGGVYNANDAVYAQIAQPNTELDQCLAQGGIYNSNNLGSSCTFQQPQIGGQVEQAGGVVDTTGWTADQFGTTVDSVGGTANVVGNVAPGFSDEEAAAAACNAGGNIYVFGQGCDVVIPMGGVIEASGTVVDMIGSAVSTAGIPAPNLGDPGIDATYCAMAAGGFGACKPGSMVTGFQLNKSLRVWENEADWYRTHPGDAPANFWDEYNQVVNPQPAAPDVAPQTSQPASQPAASDAQNYNDTLGAVHLGTGNIYVNNGLSATSNQPAQPQGGSTTVFHQPPGRVFVGSDVNVWHRDDGVTVLTDDQGNTTFLPPYTEIIQEQAQQDINVETDSTVPNAEVQQNDGYVSVQTEEGPLDIHGTSTVLQPDGSTVNVTNGQLSGGFPAPVRVGGGTDTVRGLSQIQPYIPPQYRSQFDEAAQVVRDRTAQYNQYGGRKGEEYYKAFDVLNSVCLQASNNGRSFSDYCN